ncbi:hypothetical protein VOA_002981 [Vibrio sp. RC586]|uniref:hypothetical protein n=1 Tax=Vibrio sp. RC586 TaxID=675815 RepID=UPI0001BB8086|nr:hypothetical protein [Vibrio sp. RC586]EEY97963.1 hypothetical protein VOA_002981 [Vibrio sp. RC586]
MNLKNKSDLNSELTVIINTCDSYSDVLSLFFASFSEYWPNCSFEVIVNTENNLHDNYPAIIHNYKPEGFNTWGDRFLKTLEDVRSEFVLVVYDDFILEDYINERDLISIVDFMKADPSVAVYYLINTNSPMTKINKFDNRFSEIIDYSDYKLNSAPAIWRKSDLIRYTGNHDNPWAWEVFGSYRTFNDGKKFYSLNINGSDLYPYNYTKGGAIYRGKWVRAVVLDKIEKFKLDIDVSLRGFSEDAISEARSIAWKINFICLGFKMVGFKSLNFIPRYFKAKYCAKK